MVRIGFASLAYTFGTSSAFVITSIKYSSRPWVVSQTKAKMVAASAGDFASPGAKERVCNDAFLNKDLMSRAQNGPGKVNTEKLKIGIIGAGLAGMVAAMDLADAGHDVELVELRPFVGGKASSWKDDDGNHIEMGLHAFYGSYYNLFGIMKRTGSFDNLRLKEQTHTFVNEGGKLGVLDFRSPSGAPVSVVRALSRTEQLNSNDKIYNALRLGTSPIVRALVDFNGGMDMVRELDDVTFTEWFTQLGGSRESLDRMWDPIACALGFLDCNNISARAMLTAITLFSTRTEASVLRMLKGSPQTGLHDPIIAYLEERGVKIHLNTICKEIVHDVDKEGKPTWVKGIVVGKPTRVKGILVGLEYKEFDTVVAALDVPGIKAVLPESFRRFPMFDSIYNLDCVPIATVQVRFDGWVTELNDEKVMMDVSGDKSSGKGKGIDNLLYSADSEFSCFADLAVTSPGEYYKPGEGSLIQAVFDERAFGGASERGIWKSKEQLVQDCIKQLNILFPSSHKLNCTWSSVVNLGASLYRQKPGQDKFRPKQATPVENFFLAGSYTYQDYLDSMEGATQSGLMAADEIISRVDGPNGLASNASKAKEGSSETVFFA